MKPEKIAIVGLGLMGGSLGLAIRNAFPSAKVIGVSRHLKTIKSAKRKKIIHEGYMRVASAVCDVDIVFVCTPVDTIPNYLCEINRNAKPGTIVTDVGSVKAEIVSWVDEARFQNIHFVGSHPMAGSHYRGLESAVPSLYDHASVFITPGRKTDRIALRKVSQFWKKLGSRPVIFSAVQHDKLVSSVSHLPHAIAAILIHAVPEKNQEHCGTGFLDTTRIAQGDPRIWEPIFGLNRKNLMKDLELFSLQMKKLVRILKQGKRRDLIRFLASSASLRNRL